MDTKYNFKSTPLDHNSTTDIASAGNVDPFML